MNDFKDRIINLRSQNKLVKGIYLKDLLKTAQDILKNNFYTEENCPLCLKEITKNELLDSIRERLERLKDFEKKSEKFSECKNQLLETIKTFNIDMKFIKSSMTGKLNKDLDKK